MSTAQTETQKEFKVIGTRPIRHDGVDKVTGRAVYGADVQLPGLLYGAVLRSPHAHARIKSIDTSRAALLDGVKAVITGDDIVPAESVEVLDLGEGAANLKNLRDNAMAHEKALYQGHTIAAVAAVNMHIAQEAIDLIDVDYEVLAPVVNVRDAMKEGAPLLHEDMTTESLGEDTGKSSNVARHFQFKIGDSEKAFADAETVIEREFYTATVHQGYIEPHNATAKWNEDGHLTVWTSTQGAFSARKQVSGILDHPVSHIRVVPQEIGGGFGGKIPVYLEPLAAVLSRKSGHPVKMWMTRSDVFEGTGPTPGSYLRVKMGCNSSGRLVAAEGYLAYEAGAYPGSAVGAAAMCLFACYDIPNATIDGYDVVVNKPRSFAYRAPGSTQAAFAVEAIIDEMARRLGEDQAEFRLKNASKEGTRQVFGPTFPRIGCVETLQAIKRHPHYQAPLAGPNQGRGIAIGFWFNAGLKSAATASVSDDGSVNLIEGSTDIGGSRTSIAMQFAETLGIPVEDVNPMVGDTSEIAYTDVTGGSRTTLATGMAAHRAALDVRDQLVERAAALWEIEPSLVSYEQSVFSRSDDATKTMTFKELAGKLAETGGPVMGKGSVDADSGTGGSFAANIVDVEVDPETGKVRVTRFTVFQDAGRAIHPSYVEGQMQGGSVQGIGWALNEEYFYNASGLMDNASFLDYRMPTSFDLPEIDTVIIEVPNPGHPFGVRGVGEANIAPPPAAIANAIFDATGIRLRELPMRPDRVVDALHERPSSTAQAAGL